MVNLRDFFYNTPLSSLTCLKILIFNRKYIFIHGRFFIVILVFGGVNLRDFF